MRSLAATTATAGRPESRVTTLGQAGPCRTGAAATASPGVPHRTQQSCRRPSCVGAGAPSSDGEAGSVPGTPKQNPSAPARPERTAAEAVRPGAERDGRRTWTSRAAITATAPMIRDTGRGGADGGAAWGCRLVTRLDSTPAGAASPGSRRGASPCAPGCARACTVAADRRGQGPRGSPDDCTDARPRRSSCTLVREFPDGAISDRRRARSIASRHRSRLAITAPESGAGR